MVCALFLVCSIFMHLTLAYTHYTARTAKSLNHCAACFLRDSRNKRIVLWYSMRTSHFFFIYGRKGLLQSMPNEFHLSPNELFIYLFGTIRTHLDLLLRPSVGSVFMWSIQPFLSQISASVPA